MQSWHADTSALKLNPTFTTQAAFTKGILCLVLQWTSTQDYYVPTTYVLLYNALYSKKVLLKGPGHCTSKCFPAVILRMQLGENSRYPGMCCDVLLKHLGTVATNLHQILYFIKGDNSIRELVQLDTHIYIQKRIQTQKVCSLSRMYCRDASLFLTQALRLQTSHLLSSPCLLCQHT